MNLLHTLCPVAAFVVMAAACSGSSTSAAVAGHDSISENMDEKNITVPDSNDVVVDIETTEGNMKVLLYGDTPRHRDNFVKLVNSGFYDGVLFHRVINEFMIQTGDPDSKDAAPGAMLGAGDPGYTIEAEFVYPRHFHKKGALAAARTGDNVNPERRSSGSQFYIVTGKAYTPAQLDQMQHQMVMMQQQDIFRRLTQEHRDTIMSLRRANDRTGLQTLQDELVAMTEKEASANPAKFTDEQREAYTTTGGTPHLDGQYTVFGEVIEGMDVVDKIQKTPTGSADRPVNDVRIIKMTVEK